MAEIQESKIKTGGLSLVEQMVECGGRQSEVLKNHSRLFANLTELFFICPADMMPVKQYRTLRYVNKPVDATQDGRFAGSRRPDDGYELALLYGKRNVSQRRPLRYKQRRLHSLRRI